MSRSPFSVASVVTVLLVASVAPVAAQTTTPVAAQSPAPVAEAPSAPELLERVAEADRTPYHARQLVVYFGADERESAAVLDVQSSAEGRFVRAESGGDVTRLWSGDRMGVVEGDHVTRHEGGAITQVRVKPSDVLQKYAIGVGELDEILGVEVIPLTLTRRKDDRLAERWWVHQRSGVVYRRELFDHSGDLVGMATLLDMWWGAPAPPDPVTPALRLAPLSERIESEDAPTQLDGSYELWRTYGVEVDGRPCEQWVYSDGLHALSVFRVDGALEVPDGFDASDAGGERVWTGPGPGTWAWEGGGRSYVVVAEEAGLDVAGLIEPFPKGGPSIVSRLGSVWSRLFHAVGGLFD